MVSCSSTKDHRRNLNRDVYYSHVLKELHGSPPGSTQRGQGKMWAERVARPGTCAFSKVHGWSALGYPDKG